MTRALLFLIAVAAVLAFAQTNVQTKPLPLDVKADGKAKIHIVSANDDGEAVAEAVTSPLFAFRIEEGHVEDAAILECDQLTETRQKENVDYPVVVLKCGEAKLALVGVDLTVKK